MSKNKDENSFLSQFASEAYSEAKNKKPMPGASKNEDASSAFAEKKSKIKAPDHMVVKDSGYFKGQILKWGIIGASGIVAAVLFLFGLRAFNSVELVNFTGMAQAAANQWGLANGITIQQAEVFNLDYDASVIFGQNQKAGTFVQRRTVVVVDVSLGADPNEVLDLPIFENMTTAQIMAWRQEMRAASAIQIREEYDESVEAGRFISLDYPPSVDLERFTRQNSLTVTMSRGPRMFVMPNFVGRTEEDVKEWAEEFGLAVAFERQADPNSEAGSILQQNLEPRTRFTHGDEIMVTVSVGQPIIVPNFSLMSQEDALELQDLVVIRRDRFSAAVPFGRVISQSFAPGTELLDDNPEVTVVYSLGRPFMENLIGQMESILPRFFFEEFTARGANVTYTVRYVDSYEARGSIVSMSRYGEFLGMNDHVSITVSRGNEAPPITEAPFAPENPSGPAELG